MKENYFNPNPRRYPTRHDVVKLIEKWGNRAAPDYSLIKVVNTTASSFQAAFKNPASGDVLQISIALYPNQHPSHPGWHVRDTTIWRLAKDDVEVNVQVYDPDLEILMMAYPNDRIVFTDNEDDEWPVFGYAVLGHDGIKAFRQHKPGMDDEDYTHNDDLPYGTTVTDQETLDRVNDDNWAHIMFNLSEGSYGAY